MEIKELLKKFGFSEKEVSVYLAILDLGPSLASAIAKRAKLNRSTTYVILESLTTKNFINSIGAKGAAVYQSLPTSHLVKIFEATAEKYSELSKTASKILPKLALSQLVKPSQPEVKMFTGNGQTSDVFASVLQSLENIRETKMDQSREKLEPGLNIIGDKVIFLAKDKKTGVVIESQEAADALKKSFHIA